MDNAVHVAGATDSVIAYQMYGDSRSLRQAGYYAAQPVIDGTIAYNSALLAGMGATGAGAVSGTVRWTGKSAAASVRSADIGYPPNNGFLGDFGPRGNPGVTVLRPGAMVDRFGFDGGRFAAPAGTPVGQRSLPPDVAKLPYSVFVVERRLVVQHGTAEPWFGQPGMGTQFHLPAPVRDLVKTGYLRKMQ